MATAGDIVVNLVADDRKMTRGLNRASGAVRGFRGTIDVAMGGVAKRLVAVTAATIGLSAAFRTLQSSIAKALDAEKVGVAFKVILKDGAKALELLKRLEAFAASTPFRLPELQDAAKKLLAFGFSADHVETELRRVGDIASGLGIPIGELAEIYGKARVQGRAFAEDINQLTGRGIPIIQELAKQFGVADSEVKKLVESGKVGFPQIQKAFVDLTSGAGMFAGGMEALSQTAAGKLSTLQDNVDALKRSFGNELLPVLADVTDEMTVMVKESDGLKSGVLGLATAFDVLARAAMNSMDILGKARTGWIRLGDAIGVALAGGDIGEDTLRRNEILNIAAGDKRKAIPRPAAKAPDAADAVKQRNAAEALADRLDADRDFMDRIFKSGSRPADIPLFDNDINGGIRSIPGIEMPEPPGPRLAGATSTQSADAFSMIARAGIGRSGKTPELKVQEKTEKNTNRIADLLDKFLTSDTTLAVVESF